MSNVSELVGKTLVAIKQHKDQQLIFVTEDNGTFAMWHEQDCCESVTIDDITGDLNDLIGSPITMAEESVSSTPPADIKRDYEPESETWTFYRFATVKGYVTVRWFGESNGYYSESVNFDKVN